MRVGHARLSPLPAVTNPPAAVLRDRVVEQFLPAVLLFAQQRSAGPRAVLPDLQERRGVGVQGDRRRAGLVVDRVDVAGRARLHDAGP